MTYKPLFVLLMIAACSLQAAGRNGLAALKIGAGARAAAQGEAFVAAADDASGLFWNPAGSAWLNGAEAQFTFNRWLQDIRHHTLSLCATTQYGTFGLGLMLNAVDGFEQRTIASAEPLGTFSAQTLRLTANYARRLDRKTSLGINAGYIYEKIYVEDASGWSVDLGVRRQLLNDLFLAAAFQNIGSTTRMAAERIRLPQTLRLGLRGRLPLNAFPLYVGAEYVRVFDESSGINLGVEAYPLPHLALRLGRQTGWEDKGFSAGFGVAAGRIKLDYAYVPFGHDLGTSHRFTAGLQL